MSHWMEAINVEVSRDDLPELRSIFVKIFDPDMSPLGFDAKEMYQFISRRFAGTSGDIQRQALQWLQKLCLLKIPVPIPVLLEMFNAGVDALKEDQSQNTNAAEAEAGGEANTQQGAAATDASGGGDTEGLATKTFFLCFLFVKKIIDLDVGQINDPLSVKYFSLLFLPAIS